MKYIKSVGEKQNYVSRNRIDDSTQYQPYSSVDAMKLTKEEEDLFTLVSKFNRKHK